MLHLLGLDHEKLTFLHNGANRRLTDVHGQVIRGILARIRGVIQWVKVDLLAR